MKPRLDPTIETARLTLRRPQEADLDDLVAAINDLRVSRTLGRVPYPYRRADGEAFLDAAHRAALGGRGLNLSIFRDGRLIGGIGVTNLPAYNELGYWLAYDAWGHGFTTEAGAAILAYGFEVLGLRLIRSAVYVENRASLRVQQKLGFAAIGRAMRSSLARGCAVPHIDTVLTRARYQALAR